MPEETLEESFVIVGASLAGAKAAEKLREEGFTGQVVLIGDEARRPYERPPLTKEFLTGKDPLDKAYVHEESWYADHDVDLRLGIAAEGIDRARREGRLANGERVPDTRPLPPTRAPPRRPRGPRARPPPR